MKQYASGPHRQTWRGGMDETNPPFVLPEDIGALVENAEYVGVGSLVPRRAFRAVYETDEPILYLLFLPYNANGRFCSLTASGQLFSGSADFSPGASSFAVFFYLRTTAVGGRIGKFSGSSGWEVFVSSAGRIGVRVGDGTTVVSLPDDGPVVTDGEWHAVVVNFDRSSGITRFVDGVPAGSGVSMAGLGVITSAANFVVSGPMDISQLGYALRSVEAALLSRDGLRPVPGIVSFYSFDGALPSTQPVADKGPGGNNLSFTSTGVTIDASDTLETPDRALLLIATETSLRVMEYWNGHLVLLKSHPVRDIRSGVVYQRDAFLASADGLVIYDPESHEIIVGGGVAAPTSAPTVQAGPTGSPVIFPAGRLYKYRVTFVRHTGSRIVESNPGPESAPVATGSNGRTSMTLSNIPIGGSGVTARGIYRAYSTDGGRTYTPYQLVFYIENNVTTTFSDVIEDAVWSGNPVLAVDRHAPPVARLVSRFLDRLIVAGTKQNSDVVWYSQIQEPERFPRRFGIAMDEGDISSGTIVAMEPTRDALLVFKTDSTYALTFVDSAEIPFGRLIVDTRRGALAEKATVSDGQNVFAVTPMGIGIVGGAGYDFAIGLPVQGGVVRRLASLGDRRFLDGTVVPELFAFVFAIGDRLYLFDFMRRLWHVWTDGGRTFTALCVVPEAYRPDAFFVATWDGVKAELKVWPGEGREWMRLVSRAFTPGVLFVVRSILIAGGTSGTLFVRVLDEEEEVRSYQIRQSKAPAVARVNVVAKRATVEIRTRDAEVDYIDVLGHVRTEEERGSA
jgi:hypothetical protein